MNFEVGDRVYAGDWCEGIIIEIEDDVAYVEFETMSGGGCLPFGLDELEHAPDCAEVDVDKNELIEIISNVIYKENQNALDAGCDVLCNATEYLSDKIAEALCNYYNK